MVLAGPRCGDAGEHLGSEASIWPTIGTSRLAQQLQLAVSPSRRDTQGSALLLAPQWGCHGTACSAGAGTGTAGRCRVYSRDLRVEPGFIPGTSGESQGFIPGTSEHAASSTLVLSVLFCPWTSMVIF